MLKDWVNIEYTFREQGIFFELKSWCYLCLIEGRHFYYSPQSGKWRMKGKRAWHTSQSPEDFLAQAKAYSPPDYQSTQPETQQQKSTQQKKKKQQKQTRQKTYYSYQSSYSDYHSSSSDQHQQSNKSVDGIREEFLRVFEYFLEKQRENGYKIGWIWYKLSEDFLPSPLEICWLSVVFEYSPQWAVYKIQELYEGVDQSTIHLLIKLHKKEWLEYFQKRWGIKEEHQKHQYRQQYQYDRQRQQYKQRQQYQQSQQSSRQRHSTGQTYAHQTYLKILGLTFPFTLQDLKRAYRKKALETHPDSGGTAEAFRSVHNAYQALLASC